MKKIWLSLLFLVAALAGPHLCPAQTTTVGGMQTLATVSVASYDELLADLDYLGNLGGNAELAKGLEGMLTMMTQGQGLAGIDTKRPWGLVFQTDGTQFPIYAFVPVTDLSKTLELVKLVAGAETKDLGNGVTEVRISRQGPGGGAPGMEAPEAGGGDSAPPAKSDGTASQMEENASGGDDRITAFVKLQGDWAFVSPNPEMLANVPADPTTLLAGLEKKYDLAVRASVKNLPPMYRQMAIAQVQMGAQMGMQQAPGEGAEEYAVRAKAVREVVDQVVTLINELDDVLLGWTIDRKAGASSLEFQITAVDGTKTAGQFAEVAQAKTDFAGFALPGAAVSGNWSLSMSEADVAQVKAALADVRTRALAELGNQDLSDAELKLATGLLTDLLEVVEKTVDTKKADGGLTVVLGPGSTTIVAGGRIAGGVKLENVVKQLATIAAASDPNLAGALKLDSETHQGVRFHVMTLPVPDPDAAKVLGQTVEAAIGISEDSLYAALGQKATETIKQVIDGSKSAAGKDIPPMTLTIAATPIVKFMAQVVDEEQKPMVAMAEAALQQSTGKDHLRITVTAVPRGMSTRLELEEGLLRLIATAGQMAVPMMMPGGPGDALGPGDEPPMGTESPATNGEPADAVPPAADTPAADSDPFR